MSCREASETNHLLANARHLSNEISMVFEIVTHV